MSGHDQHDDSDHLPDDMDVELQPHSLQHPPQAQQELTPDLLTALRMRLPAILGGLGFDRGKTILIRALPQIAPERYKATPADGGNTGGGPSGGGTPGGSGAGGSGGGDNDGKGNDNNEKDSLNLIPPGSSITEIVDNFIKHEPKRTLPNYPRLYVNFIGNVFVALYPFIFFSTEGLIGTEANLKTYQDAEEAELKENELNDSGPGGGGGTPPSEKPLRKIFGADVVDILQIDLDDPDVMSKITLDESQMYIVPPQQTLTPHSDPPTEETDGQEDIASNPTDATTDGNDDQHQQGDVQDPTSPPTPACNIPAFPFYKQFEKDMTREQLQETQALFTKQLEVVDEELRRQLHPTRQHLPHQQQLTYDPTPSGADTIDTHSPGPAAQPSFPLLPHGLPSDPSQWQSGTQIPPPPYPDPRVDPLSHGQHGNQQLPGLGFPPVSDPFPHPMRASPHTPTQDLSSPTQRQMHPTPLDILRFPFDEEDYVDDDGDDYDDDDDDEEDAFLIVLDDNGEPFLLYIGDDDEDDEYDDDYENFFPWPPEEDADDYDEDEDAMIAPPLHAIQHRPPLPGTVEAPPSQRDGSHQMNPFDPHPHPQTYHPSETTTIPSHGPSALLNALFNPLANQRASLATLVRMANHSLSQPARYRYEMFFQALQPETTPQQLEHLTHLFSLGPVDPDAIDYTKPPITMAFSPQLLNLVMSQEDGATIEIRIDQNEPNMYTKNEVLYYATKHEIDDIYTKHLANRSEIDERKLLLARAHMDFINELSSGALTSVPMEKMQFALPRAIHASKYLESIEELASLPLPHHVSEPVGGQDTDATSGDNIGTITLSDDTGQTVIVKMESSSDTHLATTAVEETTLPSLSSIPPHLLSPHLVLAPPVTSSNEILPRARLLTNLYENLLKDAARDVLTPKRHRKTKLSRETFNAAMDLSQKVATLNTIQDSFIQMGELELPVHANTTSTEYHHHLQAMRAPLAEEDRLQFERSLYLYTTLQARVQRQWNQEILQEFLDIVDVDSSTSNESPTVITMFIDSDGNVTPLNTQQGPPAMIMQQLRHQRPAGHSSPYGIPASPMEGSSGHPMDGSPDFPHEFTGPVSIQDLLMAGQSDEFQDVVHDVKDYLPPPPEFYEFLAEPLDEMPRLYVVPAPTLNGHPTHYVAYFKVKHHTDALKLSFQLAQFQQGLRNCYSATIDSRGVYEGMPMANRLRQIDCPLVFPAFPMLINYNIGYQISPLALSFGILAPFALSLFTPFLPSHKERNERLLRALVQSKWYEAYLTDLSRPRSGSTLYQPSTGASVLTSELTNLLHGYSIDSGSHSPHGILHTPNWTRHPALAGHFSTILKRFLQGKLFPDTASVYNDIVTQRVTDEVNSTMHQYDKHTRESLLKSASKAFQKDGGHSHELKKRVGANTVSFQALNEFTTKYLGTPLPKTLSHLLSPAAGGSNAAQRETAHHILDHMVLTGHANQHWSSVLPQLSPHVTPDVRSFNQYSLLPMNNRYGSTVPITSPYSRSSSTGRPKVVSMKSEVTFPGLIDRQLEELYVESYSERLHSGKLSHLREGPLAFDYNNYTSKEAHKFRSYSSADYRYNNHLYKSGVFPWSKRPPLLSPNPSALPHAALHGLTKLSPLDFAHFRSTVSSAYHGYSTLASPVVAVGIAMLAQAFITYHKGAQLHTQIMNTGGPEPPDVEREAGSSKKDSSVSLRNAAIDLGPLKIEIIAPSSVDVTDVHITDIAILADNTGGWGPAANDGNHDRMKYVLPGFSDPSELEIDLQMIDEGHTDGTAEDDYVLVPLDTPDDSLQQHHRSITANDGIDSTITASNNDPQKTAQAESTPSEAGDAEEEDLLSLDEKSIVNLLRQDIIEDTKINQQLLKQRTFDSKITDAAASEWTIPTQYSLSGLWLTLPVPAQFDYGHWTIPILFYAVAYGTSHNKTGSHALLTQASTISMTNRTLTHAPTMENVLNSFIQIYIQARSEVQSQLAAIRSSANKHSTSPYIYNSNSSTLSFETFVRQHVDDIMHTVEKGIRAPVNPITTVAVDPATRTMVHKISMVFAQAVCGDTLSLQDSIAREIINANANAGVLGKKSKNVAAQTIVDELKADTIEATHHQTQQTQSSLAHKFANPRHRRRYLSMFSNKVHQSMTAAVADTVKPKPSHTSTVLPSIKPHTPTTTTAVNPRSGTTAAQAIAKSILGAVRNTPTLSEKSKPSTTTTKSSLRPSPSPARYSGIRRLRPNLPDFTSTHFTPYNHPTMFTSYEHYAQQTAATIRGLIESGAIQSPSKYAQNRDKIFLESIKAEQLSPIARLERLVQNLAAKIAARDAAASKKNVAATTALHDASAASNTVLLANSGKQVFPADYTKPYQVTAETIELSRRAMAAFRGLTTHFHPEIFSYFTHIGMHMQLAFSRGVSPYYPMLASPRFLFGVEFMTMFTAYTLFFNTAFSKIFLEYADFRNQEEMDYHRLDNLKSPSISRGDLSSFQILLHEFRTFSPDRDSIPLIDNIFLFVRSAILAMPTLTLLLISTLRAYNTHMEYRVYQQHIDGVRHVNMNQFIQSRNTVASRTLTDYLALRCRTVLAVLSGRSLPYSLLTREAAHVVNTPEEYGAVPSNYYRISQRVADRFQQMKNFSTIYSYYGVSSQYGETPRVVINPLPGKSADGSVSSKKASSSSSSKPMTLSALNEQNKRAFVSYDESFITRQISRMRHTYYSIFDRSKLLPPKIPSENDILTVARSKTAIPVDLPVLPHRYPITASPLKQLKTHYRNTAQYFDLFHPLEVQGTFRRILTAPFRFMLTSIPRFLELLPMHRHLSKINPHYKPPNTLPLFHEITDPTKNHREGYIYPSPSQVGMNRPPLQASFFKVTSFHMARLLATYTTLMYINYVGTGKYVYAKRHNEPASGSSRKSGKEMDSQFLVPSKSLYHDDPTISDHQETLDSTPQSSSQKAPVPLALDGLLKLPDSVEQAQTQKQLNALRQRTSLQHSHATYTTPKFPYEIKQYIDPSAAATAYDSFANVYLHHPSNFMYRHMATYAYPFPLANNRPYKSEPYSTRMKQFDQDIDYDNPQTYILPITTDNIHQQPHTLIEISKAIHKRMPHYNDYTDVIPDEQQKIAEQLMGKTNPTFDPSNLSVVTPHVAYKKTVNSSQLHSKYDFGRQYSEQITFKRHRLYTPAPVKPPSSQKKGIPPGSGAADDAVDKGGPIAQFLKRFMK